MLKLQKIQEEKVQEEPYSTEITLLCYDTNWYVLAHFPIKSSLL